MTKRKQILKGLSQLWSFRVRVLRDFRRNQGMLLSGAVAYYTLLSIVPASILALIVLSNFVHEEQLFQTLSTYLELLIPGYTATLTKMVNIIYGSFATAVVALLSIEAAVLILLLGAQVIAELQPKSHEMDKEKGLHDEPSESLSLVGDPLPEFDFSSGQGRLDALPSRPIS